MNIAIVDNHLVLGQSLALSLEKLIISSQVRVFKSATSFLDVDFTGWHPDLVIVGILMPMISGLELIEKAKVLLNDHCKFIVLSSVTDPNTIKDAIRKGGHGYVEKGAPLNELMEAINTVMSNKQYISHSLRDDLIKYMLNDESAEVGLSPRENEVLQRICAGRTPKEIAFEMNLSLHTVQLYNKNLLRKFKLRRTAELMVFALKNGLCNPNL